MGHCSSYLAEVGAVSEGEEVDTKVGRVLVYTVRHL